MIFAHANILEIKNILEMLYNICIIGFRWVRNCEKIGGKSRGAVPFGTDKAANVTYFPSYFLSKLKNSLNNSGEIVKYS